MSKKAIRDSAGWLGERREWIKEQEQYNTEAIGKLLLSAKKEGVPIATTARLLKISRPTAYRLMVKV